MATVKPIPSERQELSPYLIVKGADRALAFYAAAFGAKEIFKLTEPNGKVGHAELQIGRSQFSLADEYPDFGALSPVTIGGTPVSMHLYVEDVDKAVERAVAAGATMLRPVTDEFFGDRTCMVSDPFGHKWHLASRKELVSPAEMQKRMNAAYK